MSESVIGRRLRAGMVGGGRGAFIGSIHRFAAELDGQALVVAGALSSDAQVAEESAAAWFLERSYDSYERMAREEAARADGIDFVIVATPNHLHFPVARAFLESGIHVVCDKPLALTLEEAEGLGRLATTRRSVLALTHNYSGYPAVREFAALARAGVLGELRKILVEYQQDWLMRPLESQGHKQASWRTDPLKAGLGGCLGDIGTHAEHLLRFVTGQEITALCADVSTFVAGRSLDDDANILLRLSGGAKGVLSCSQIACGEENDLSIRLYGDRAGLEWRQQDPNSLILKPAGEPWRRLRTGQGYLGTSAKECTRLPPGHPEGFIEAFANLYASIIADIRRSSIGEPLRGGYPDVNDGIHGLRFVAKAVESSRLGAQWVTLRGESAHAS